MQDPVVRHSYVQVNGSYIHLQQYCLGESEAKHSQSSATHGDSFDTTKTSSSIGLGEIIASTNSSSDEATKTLVVFVPGNPGVLGMYHDFISSLSRAINSNSELRPESSTTILAISHNNFDHPDHANYKADERICIKESELNFVEKAIASKYLSEPHHVELQVLNKLIILRRLLKSNDRCRLIFVGHSIGCYVILRLLQDKSIAAIHQGSILIHPALENLASTQKGSYYCRVFDYKLDMVVYSLCYLVSSILPETARVALTKRFCSPKFVQGSSEIVIESLAQLTCRKTLTALIEMAKSELRLIKNINTELMIRPHADKLKMIYAIDDHWVNTENRKVLKDSYPHLHIEEHPNIHAFIMDTQTVVDYAVKVGLFIQGFIDNIGKLT